MYWIILVIAGLCECAFSFCLGKAKAAIGLNHWMWIGLFVVFCGLSMFLLLKSIRVFPLSTAYPVWTGIGAEGTVLLGVLLFHEPASFWKVFFTATLILSIIGLKTVAA
ncbi:MAG: multidrug efflux SMR transporter [Prevotella sp.]|nr:multidrug efflux SMR transporter [Prevotella sp.]